MHNWLPYLGALSKCKDIALSAPVGWNVSAGVDVSDVSIECDSFSHRSSGQAARSVGNGPVMIAINCNH